MADSAQMSICTTEMHTCGEPVRIIEKGFPDISCAARLLEKRRLVLEKYDSYRRRLMAEPRGHPAMYGALLVEAEFPQEAHLSVLFLHNEGLSTMCGHAVIALGRYAVDKGVVPRPVDGSTATVNIHCPCGIVPCQVTSTGYVSFCSVKAFVVSTNVQLRIPMCEQTIEVDVVFGGAFYAMVDCHRFGLDIKRDAVEKLAEFGDQVKQALMPLVKLSHPDSDELCFIYGAILMDGREAAKDESSNLCIFADRQVDRSPCGSGITAQLALQHYTGTATFNQTKLFHNSKVPHSTFTAKVAEVTAILLPGEGMPRPAVRVEVGGKAFYTGTSTFTAEDDDKLANGFLIR